MPLVRYVRFGDGEHAVSSTILERIPYFVENTGDVVWLTSRSGAAFCHIVAWAKNGTCVPAQYAEDAAFYGVPREFVESDGTCTPDWLRTATPAAVSTNGILADDGLRVCSIRINGESTGAMPFIQYKKTGDAAVSLIEVKRSERQSGRNHVTRLGTATLAFTRALLPARVRELLDEHERVHGIVYVPVPFLNYADDVELDESYRFIVHFDGTHAGPVGVITMRVGAIIRLIRGHRDNVVDYDDLPSKAICVLFSHNTGRIVPPPVPDMLRFAVENHKVQDECGGMPVFSANGYTPTYNASYRMLAAVRVLV